MIDLNSGSSEKPKFLYATPGGKICFTIVGCGGTGGYLIRDLARIIAISNEQYERQDGLILIDADVVRI